MKPSDLLHQAGTELAQRGYHKGDLTGLNGEVCALGAMHYAAMALVPGLQTYTQALGYLRQAGQIVHITSWNDDPHTTAEDVALAFKQAEAAALEAGE
ncbi:hypothetical protein [Streptomyces sp. NPDC093261]|uniref:DUF6197 family protein n=1 Tax=Streptomyces sp. NPDC093261 TaxID=3366037 RepID=UPI00381A1943